MTYPRRAIPQRKVRTQADMKNDAIQFVWMARDHIIADMTADRLALMKGVTKPAFIDEIRTALVARQERLA